MRGRALGVDQIGKFSFFKFLHKHLRPVLEFEIELVFINRDDRKESYFGIRANVQHGEIIGNCRRRQSMEQVRLVFGA